MDDLVKKINSGGFLDFNDSQKFFEGFINGDYTDAQMASTLMAMKFRQVSAEEIAGAAMVLNRQKVRFMHDKEFTVDTCGTGGDGKSTLNVSTAVAVNLASMDYNVIKHGNSAQSGKVGSADILSMLDVPVRMEKEDAEAYFMKNNFVFLFAPFYHPALKNVGKVRKEIKVPTIFNYLGPLLNPGDPSFQIIGINSREMLPVYADASLMLGRKNMVVYCSEDNFDEVSTFTRTKVFLIKEGVLDKIYIEPAEFFDPFPMPIIESETEAKEMFISAIKGDNDHLAKLIAINSAIALILLENVTLKDAYNWAYDNIKSGKPYEKYLSLRG